MAAYSSFTDFQLTTLLKENDETAFAEIYTRYAESLAGFAASKLYSLDDARDIIHDLFLKFWEDREKHPVISNLKAYLFTLTRYRIVDKIRKNITREEYAEMLQNLAINNPPAIDQQIAAKELQQTIDKSLEALSPRLKEIYLLSREDNLSITEISDKLQLSEQTVKNQLSAALKHLRKSLSVVSTPAFLLWLLS